MDRTKPKSRRIRSVVVFAMAAALALLAGATLVGCARGGAGAASSPAASIAAAGATTQATIAASSSPPAVDAEPPDDLLLPHRSKAGRLPGQALRMRAAAANRHNWRSVYLLTAYPASSFAASVREWAQSNDQTRDLRILETRVIGSGKGKGDAIVRVTFSGWTTPPEGKRYAVRVPLPGEWLHLAKVHGLWKLVVDT